jgi:hypothetical protein
MTNRPTSRVAEGKPQTHVNQAKNPFKGYDSYCKPIVYCRTNSGRRT